MNRLIASTLKFAGSVAPAGCKLCCAVLLAGAGCSKAPPAPAAAGTNAPAKAPAAGGTSTGNVAQAEHLPVKSLFDFKQGNLDPFFPLSERLAEKPKTTTATQKVEPVVDLVVKTIIPGPSPRAWINNRSFVAGEELELRMPDGKRVRVKCVEIRARSVIVEIEGVPGQKEVPLRMR